MFAIGKLEIKSRLLLAPVAGYFDSPFRSIARKHGAGLVVTELISSEAVIRNATKTMELLAFTENERPLGIQLFGKSPEVMAEAARIIEQYKPEFIDINMGCPAIKVCKGGAGAGAALLLDPELVYRIAESVVTNVNLPVTAKIRLGWDEDHVNYNENVQALESAGISLITVHGRTRTQRHDGVVDWDAIKEIKESASVPVVGNGGIKTFEQAMERMEYSGCDAVMIGQGAYGNPWIFSGTQPSQHDIIEQIKEHLDLMIEYYGEKGILLMRKHIVKYIGGFRNAKETRQMLVTSASRDDIFRILDTLPL